ncbi:hypothetical protein [Pseudonocardia sp. 73-21]|uniref:hypothetical protein n=1 Tax=Pseudonocardia sp. 73-21 TaxID=1895809 RepID=UPI0009614F70|nr:hypothetical protein [Pseudonocardia sp. 73-21]OJY40672.1 MAG: hypothetical protein BGP03_26390 [Pseudonocardia sp. 73-21]
MSNLFGRRAAILSYRLGMADGVSVTAAQWGRALRRLGVRVRTVAGDGRPDVLIRSLALESRRPPRRRELAAALDDVDVVVVDNVCSLPMNQGVGEAVAEYLQGRPAVLRHHDLPWEREKYAGLTTWPPHDPSWRHVTINEMARHALEERRGIAATTIYHGFDERPCPEQRDAVRRRLKVGDEPLVLQPTRAIARKGIEIGLAATAAVGGTYWLTGPAEDGYQAELRAVLGAGGVPVRRRLPFGVQMPGAYAACAAVALPSRCRRAAVVVGGIRAAPDRVGAAPQAHRGRRLPGGARAGGVRFPLVRRVGPLDAEVVPRRSDPSLLDHNEAIAKAHFGIDALARLELLLSGAPICAHFGAPEQDVAACGCLIA